MDRPLSVCDACGGVDDHPKHRLWDPDPDNDLSPPDGLFKGQDLTNVPTNQLEQALSSDVRVRHFDCCAADGCEVCAAAEKATGALRGQELIDHLAAERGEA